MKACMPAILALTCAMAVAGCGRSETTPTSATATLAAVSPTESGTPSHMPEPSDSSDAADPAVPPTEAKSAGPEPAASTVTCTAAPLLERDAGEYGDALMNAWMSGDASAVACYASPAAAAALQKAKPNANLLRTVCESNMCSYADEAGQRVTLTFDEELITEGAQHAVTGVRIGS